MGTGFSIIAEEMHAHGNGSVHMTIVHDVGFPCKFDLRFFPADQQDCRLCPPFSSTLNTYNASSRAQCLCDVGYFDDSSRTGAETPDCRPCRVGTTCPDQGKIFFYSMTS